MIDSIHLSIIHNMLILLTCLLFNYCIAAFVTILQYMIAEWEGTPVRFLTEQQKQGVYIITNNYSQFLSPGSHQFL